LGRRSRFPKRSNKGRNKHHSPPPQSEWTWGKEPLTARQANMTPDVGFVDPDKIAEVYEGPRIMCWNCGEGFRQHALYTHMLACNDSTMWLGVIIAPSVRLYKYSMWGLPGWREDQCVYTTNDAIRQLAGRECTSFKDKYIHQLNKRSITLSVTT
jgi:hypothetical protein